MGDKRIDVKRTKLNWITNNWIRLYYKTKFSDTGIADAKHDSRTADNLGVEFERFVLKEIAR